VEAKLGSGVVPKNPLCCFCPHAAIDDEIDAVQQGLGEAGGGVGALLVAVVERGGGAAAVGGEFIEADRGSTRRPPGKPSFWSSPDRVRNAVRPGVV